MPLPRLDWNHVLGVAARIVESYDTNVTLRQLFYRLVSMELIENTQGRYNALSSRTAQARREGWFPSLIDPGREIYRPAHWSSPESAMQALRKQYRRDRTENQEFSVYIGVEKMALAELLRLWFGKYGIGVLVLRGYASQTYIDDIAEEVNDADRPAILIYGGDFDPSGMDIQRDFVSRTGCWEFVERVALSWELVEQYNLPPLPGKASDSRAARFEEEHGQLVQVELDALPPDTLRELYEAEFDRWWDQEVYESVLEQEERDRARLKPLPPKPVKGEE